MKRWVSIAIAGLLLNAVTHAAQVGLIKIDGAIGPATANYISRALDVAADQNDECLVIQLNTPGGLLEFHERHRAGLLRVESADRRLCFAGRRDGRQRGRLHHAGGGHRGDGAAHDHRRGASGGAWAQRQDETTNSIMMQKVGNAYTPVHADHRRKTASQCRMGKILRASKAHAITSEEALKMKVIDLIATNVPDLLKQLDGRKVDDKILNTAERRASWKFR